MVANSPEPKRVVLVGAGHAHVGVLREFGKRPLPGLRLTLVTRRRHSPYSGMLPGLVAGLYTFDDAHIDTRPLCAFAGAALIEDEVVGLDLAGRRVLRREGPPLPFDLLSLDLGSTPNTGAVPGATEHALPVKPIDGFLERFADLRRRVLGEGGRARIGVVGAGAGGVELLLALERRLRRDVAEAGHDPRGLAFSLVAASAKILPGFPERMQRRFAALLRERGVAVLTGAPAVAVDDRGIEIEGGQGLELDEVVWTTQAAAPPFLKETGLALDADGFVRVGPDLRSVSHPAVFAAGDVAALEDHPIPKAGVYAVRQAPVLAGNLRRAASGAELLPYRPQREALYIISTGERTAVGTRNGLVVEGAWVWRVKDWIDRRFMRQYSGLLPRAAPSGDR